MSNVTYHVGGRGCGKTAWLIDKLEEVVTKDPETCICLLIKHELEYRNFMEYMYSRLGRLIQIRPIEELEDVPSNCILLVDNLLRLNMHMTAIDRIFSACKEVYVTIDGKSEQENKRRYKDPWSEKFEQLTIDTQGETNEG